ncbi:MAG: Rab family GTPase [Promethearchaeota archaeon]
MSRVKNFKVIVCGEGGIGKTAFLNAFKKGSYEEEPGMTVAIEPHVLYFERENKQKINLQIWDLSGQEQFVGVDGLYKKFCYAANGAIVCFDLGEPTTIERLPRWLDLLPDKIPKILVGTKEDTAEGLKGLVRTLLDASGIRDDFKSYIEISAKGDLLSVHEIFKKLLVETCRINEEEADRVIQKYVNVPEKKPV